MTMIKTKDEMQRRAADALRSVLSEISTIKLKEIRCEPVTGASSIGITAFVDVFGRTHTLACDVQTSALSVDVHAALDSLRDGAANVASDATPVLIAPHISLEAQAICKECSAGFVDLEGNARLALGEVFIGKRTMQQRHHESVPLDASPSQSAKSRPPAPTVYIASNIPGAPAPMRKRAGAGIAVV